MPRPERPLSPNGSPLHTFAADLRKLRESAGNPKYLQMQRMTGKSRTALAEAAGGDHLPTWETVAAYVNACNGDQSSWRVRWELVRDEVRRAPDREIVVTEIAETDTTASGTEPTTSTLTDNTRQPLQRGDSSRDRAIMLVVGLVIGAVLGAIGLELLGNTFSLSRQGGQQAILTVQNKIAIGASEIVEDATPAYLSSSPTGFCADRGCKIDETDLASGDPVVATCFVRGEMMWNYNLDSPARRNPYRIESDVWYAVSLPGGRQGYLAEVFVVPPPTPQAGLLLCK